MIYRKLGRTGLNVGEIGLGCEGFVQNPALAQEFLDAAEQAGLHVFEVSGPGVADVNRFAVDRSAWAEARAARGDEFPCGIEILLVDAEGRAVAVPRSARVRAVACAQPASEEVC